MNIQLLNQNISDASSDISLEYITKEQLKKHKNKKALKLAGFSAAADSICFLHNKNTLFCGVEEFCADDIRSVSAIAIKALKSTNYKSANVAIDDKSIIFALVEGFVLGGYTYDRYKSKKEKPSLKNISLIYTKDDYKAAIKTFSDAIIVADATCFTRDIVNTIPEDLNPPTFAKLAKELAKENDLECEVLGEKELKKERCNSMLAVGRASRHDSKLIHLTYKPKNPKKVVSLIGKGLTYDS
ncbi:MAG: M17 family peptidase N-terminal domain-containing protein, partial [Campylobacterota bacterium]|nr:M17 family peptidase N-terminal domain-containing protein [Campylobacterota bacterium]